MSNVDNLYNFREYKRAVGMGYGKRDSVRIAKIWAYAWFLSSCDKNGTVEDFDVKMCKALGRVE